MFEVTLYEPTDLIKLAFEFKRVPHIYSKTPRERLAEIPGPAMEFQTTLVISEPAILGWLDKRYPFPELFPSDPTVYSKASTLAYAMEQNPETAKMLWEARNKRFLTGNHPTIADLVLIKNLAATNDGIRTYRNQIMDYGLY